MCVCVCVCVCVCMCARAWMYRYVYFCGVTLILLRIQHIRPFMNTTETANVVGIAILKTRERCWRLTMAHALITLHNCMGPHMRIHCKCKRTCMHVLTRVELGAKTVSHLCSFGGGLVASSCAVSKLIFQ